MKNVLHVIIAGLILIAFQSRSYSQKEEEIPFNEQPEIRVSQLKVSSQSNNILIDALITNSSDASVRAMDLFIFVDGQIINKQQINLSPHFSKPVIYEWKKLEPGEHLIKVIADPDEKLNESDRSDNDNEINIHQLMDKILFDQLRKVKRRIKDFH